MISPLYSPLLLQELFRYAHHGHSLKLIVPNVSSASGLRAFSFAGPKIYNSLPDSVKMCYTDDMFKTALKTFLFNLTSDEVEKLYASC